MNGNIVSMSRVICDKSHSLEFMNTGNHTAGIFDRTSGGHTRYLHDDDGRLVYSADIDPSGNGIRYDFQYNSQGLVEKVTRNDSLLVEYSYLSDGTRTETRMKDGTVFRYRGNFVFRTDPDGKSWYYSTSGDFIRHIKDKDDAIYIITDQQVEASALKERKLKSYRTDDNMFGRMLDKDFPNDIATKIFADLFDKANRTVENGNDKIVDCKYSIIVEEKKEKASEYAETKKESKKLIINLAATWYKGYDVISVFAHEMGHMIDDVNLPTRKDEERRAAAERFADEKAMEHWSFLKISNKAIEDLESHYITNGGTL